MTIPAHFMQQALMLLLAASAGSAAALDISLPSETISYKSSGMPGYQLALRHCLICHSAHYVQSQPASSPRPYWEATVHKMKTAFGAQFADDDMPALVDYLTQTYGAQQEAAPAKPVAVVEAESEKSHKARTMVKRMVIRKTILAPLVGN